MSEDTEAPVCNRCRKAEPTRQLNNRPVCGPCYTEILTAACGRSEQVVKRKIMGSRDIDLIHILTPEEETKAKERAARQPPSFMSEKLGLLTALTAMDGRRGFGFGPDDRVPFEDVVNGNVRPSRTRRRRANSD